MDAVDTIDVGMSQDVGCSAGPHDTYIFDYLSGSKPEVGDRFILAEVA
jgi:hypothetical protein